MTYSHAMRKIKTINNFKSVQAKFCYQIRSGQVKFRCQKRHKKILTVESFLDFRIMNKGL